MKGGTFYRTYTTSAGFAGGFADPATVSSFRLDKYLVTVGRFRRFVRAWNGGKGWLPPTGAGKHGHLNNGNGLMVPGGGFEPGWVASDNAMIAPTTSNLVCGDNYSTWTGSAGANETLPINCVTWQEAYAFCIWDGGFLPSEAEWEYAAVGGAEQREYPWGSTDPGTQSEYAIYSCLFPTGSTSCPGYRGAPDSSGSNIAPVGTAWRGAGLWGQVDLEGEMGELNMDWETGLGSGPYVDPCVDCANLSPTWSARVISGCSFSIGPAWACSPSSNAGGSMSRDGEVGFSVRKVARRRRGRRRRCER